MICQVCKKPRERLKVSQSKLMESVRLNLCALCLKEGKEPRHLIILVGRSRGFDAVEPYISERKYVGDEILASELAR